MSWGLLVKRQTINVWVTPWFDSFCYGPSWIKLTIFCRIMTQTLMIFTIIDQDYDTDKLFPALGFGARVPPEGKVACSLFILSNIQPSFLPLWAIQQLNLSVFRASNFFASIAIISKSFVIAVQFWLNQVLILIILHSVRVFWLCGIFFFGKIHFSDDLSTKLVQNFHHGRAAYFINTISLKSFLPQG